MIAPKLDLLDSLGALIGASTPAAPGDGADFAGMLAAAKTAPQGKVIAPSPDGEVAVTPPIPDAPLRTADLVEPVSAPEQPAPTKSIAVAQKAETIPPNAESEDAKVRPKSPDRVIQGGGLPKPGLRKPVLNGSPDADRAPKAGIESSGAEDDQIPAISEAPALVAFVAAPAVDPAVSLVVATDVPTGDPTPQRVKARAAESRVEQAVAPTNDVRVAIAAPVLAEPVKPTAKPKPDVPDPTIGAPLDQRPLPAMMASIPDKPVLALPDRVPTFAPLIADAVRDLVSIAQDKDLRFNVRPETLGSVAVTIERGEAGLGLRLGVETPAAAHAVRQAEPMLNDVRTNAPFVQISVDLNSPDTRERSARAAAFVKRARQDRPETAIQPQPVTTGRYA